MGDDESIGIDRRRWRGPSAGSGGILSSRHGQRQEKETWTMMTTSPSQHSVDFDLGTTIHSFTEKNFSCTLFRQRPSLKVKHGRPIYHNFSLIISKDYVFIIHVFIFI